MHDAPAIRLSAKHHRSSQFLSRGLGLRGHARANDFSLYEIGKVASYRPAYFLSGASAIGIFFADPAQPIRDVLPPAFDTAEAAAKGNVIRTRPERLERRRPSLHELLDIEILRVHDPCLHIG